MPTNYKDITATGEQTWRDLQSQNELGGEATSNELPEDYINFLSDLEAAYPIPSEYDPYANSPKEFRSSLYNDEGPVLDYFGRSKYDKTYVNPYELQNLGDIRAESQPAAVKIASGIGKAATLAGTTFLDSTLGLIIGSGSIAIESVKDLMGKGEREGFAGNLSYLFDNVFSNAMSQVNKAMETILPNYATQEEQQREWYKNLGTANFWADFIKQTGFMVGALYGGGVWTKGLKALGAITTGTQAKWLGATLSAVNEGRIEANNNSDDWEKLELQQAHDAVIDGLKRDYPGITTEDAERIWQEDNQEILDDIAHRKAMMGLTDLAINVPLLMVDNFLTFGKLYARGFASSRRASEKQVQDNFKQRLRKGIADAEKQEAKREAGKQVLQEGGRYIWKDITVADALKTGGKAFLREGAEEMSQMYASEFAGTINQLDSPDSYYAALTDPKALEETKTFLQGITTGFANSYGDLSKYQDFFVGGLMGLLGAPTFGRNMTSSKETYLGRNKMVGLTGGLGGALRARAEENRIGRETVDEINAYLEKYGKPFTDRARHFAASNAFTDAMNGWAAENNAFEYHNAADNEEFNTIDRYASIGKLDDYKQLVNQDFENISDEDLELIAQQTVDTTTGKPLWINADGSLMSSTETGRAQMRKELAEKRDKILNGIDKYEQYLGEMRAISRIEDNDNAVRELAWLKWKINRFADRRESIIDENQDLLKKVISAINENAEGLERTIAELDEAIATTESSEERNNAEGAKKIAQNIVALNRGIQSIIEGWVNKTPQSLTLTKEGLDTLLSDDFHKTLSNVEDVDYDDYRRVMESIADLSKLSSLAKTFKERYQYYLDDSQKPKSKRSKKKDTEETSTPEPVSPTDAQEATIQEEAQTTSEEQQQAAEDSENQPIGTAKRGEEVTPEVAPNLTKTKLDIDHQDADDARVAEARKEKFNKITDELNGISTASSLNELLKKYKDDAEALKFINDDINRVKSEDSNKELINAWEVNRVINKAFERLNTRIEGSKITDKAENIANLLINLSKSPLNVSSLVAGILGDVESLADVFGSSMNDSQRAYVEGLRQELSDLFNKIEEDLAIADSIPNSKFAKPTDSETTGADDNPSNTPVDTSSVTPSEDESITIVDNDGDASINYNAERANQTDTTVDEVRNQNNGKATEKLLPREAHNYISPLTTEAPRTQESSERIGEFGYDAWVDSHKDWDTTSVKARHAALERLGAFDLANSGYIAQLLRDNAPIKFKVIKSVNNEAQDFVVFITDDKGNIIGDLGSPKAATANNFAGQRELLTLIEAQYKEAGSPDEFVPSSLVTHISKVLLGRVPYTDTPLTIADVNPDLILGVCINASSRTITASTKGSPIVRSEEIVAPLSPVNGQVYVLLPNGNRDGKNNRNAYTPVLCTSKRYTAETKDTELHKKVDSCIEKLLSSKDYKDFKKNIGELGRYLWVKGLHFNAYDASGKLISDKNPNGPITNVSIKIEEGPASARTFRTLVNTPTSDISRATSLVVDTLEKNNTPFHINTSLINTKAGKAYYSQIVQVNLPAGTTTTINNWFAINPIIDGKEVPATAPTSTGTNPNKKTDSPGKNTANNDIAPAAVPTPTNMASYTFKGEDGNEHKLSVDGIDMIVYIDGVQQTPMDISDPRHINSLVNRALAYQFMLQNPETEVRNGVYKTPYGWYNRSQKKLVPEPSATEVLGGLKRDSETPEVPTQETPTPTAEAQQVTPSTDSDILGQAEINGKTEDIRLSELQNAKRDGYGYDLDFNSPIEDIAKAIEEWRNSDDYYREVSNIPYKVFNREKELTWLKRVLPNLTDADRVQLVEGLIHNKAWGMFSKGIMYLSNEAAEGTTYHEAFHAVSLTLLNNKERARMYEAAREEYDVEGNMTPYELEEALAEGFREYVQKHQEPELNALGRFFRKLRNWIQNLRGKQMVLNQLFYDINNGIYADRTMDIQRGEQFTNYMNAIVNQKELDDIKAKAIADGTFMKAPNGNPTNLNEKQWLQVRTKAFKDWFGDWEKSTSNVSLNETSHTGTGRTQYYEYKINENDGYVAVAIDTKNKTINITGIEAIKGKGFGVNSYIALQNKFPEYTINSDEEALSIDAERMWDRMVAKGIAIKNSDKNYTLKLPNASKVVDENGEPLVVYHGGSSKNIEVFDIKSKSSTPMTKKLKKKFYFTSNKFAAEQYAKSREYRQAIVKARNMEAMGIEYNEDFIPKENSDDFLYPVFLNFRNPVEIDALGQYISSVPKKHRDLIDNSENAIITNINESTGYFPVIVTDYLTNNPNQIKSADGNVGTFSTESDNIYYRTQQAIGEEIMAIEEEQEYHIIETSRMSFPTRGEALDEIADRKWDRIAYVDQWHGRYYIRPNRRVSLEALLDQLDFEWATKSDEVLLENLKLRSSLEYDRLAPEVSSMLADRGVTPEIWNDLSLGEKLNAVECAGVY